LLPFGPMPAGSGVGATPGSRARSGVDVSFNFHIQFGNTIVQAKLVGLAEVVCQRRPWSSRCSAQWGRGGSTQGKNWHGNSSTSQGRYTMSGSACIRS
jgi:hypothetical protein